MLHRHPTRLSLSVCAIVALLACVPASAGAATAPTLKSPAAKADPVTEGGSVTFEWTGSLQGDPDAIDRSFFRVELIAESKVPTGTQSEWPSDELEAYTQTAPGEADATTATLGVPSAGEWRWRVCAWGVVDDLVANQIEQLPGGCSAARAITTVAAGESSQVPGELKMEERRQVDGEVRTVFVERPAEPTRATPTEPAPIEPTEAVEEALPPATFSEVLRTTAESGKGSALGGIGGGSTDIESLDADEAADREGVTGTVIGGLGANLPFVPIPFWTLLLLVACVPILRVWRRSVLGMFEWSDGSIDGAGGMGSVHGELAPVAVASDVKDTSMSADGDAPAPAPLASSNSDAPGRGRHAA